MHLDGKQFGRQTALSQAGIRMMSIMFKITQNTMYNFSLAEILIMAAMNETAAKGKTAAKGSQSEGTSQLGVGHDH